MNVSEVEEAEEQHPRQPLCSQSGRKLSCGVEEGRGGAGREAEQCGTDAQDTRKS